MLLAGRGGVNVALDRRPGAVSILMPMVRPSSIVRTVLAGGLLAAGPAWAQVNYEDQYGRPVDVSVTDLAQNPDQYINRSVRVRGRLEMNSGFSGPTTLRDSFSAAVLVLPAPGIQGEWEQIAPRILGQEVQVVGVVQGRTDTFSRNPNEASVIVVFWSFQGPPEKVSTDALKKAVPVTLESLVTKPGARDGTLVRVVGMFRGKNLYGDLPSRSAREGGDWVIKDDAFAVWISGKKPKGKGFQLDSSLKRDTNKWIEVVGRPTTVRGVVYIEAADLSLTTPPSATAQVQAPPPPPERPKFPPVIVFAMPLDGELDVPPDSRFVVQFSKDMDEDSFKGHVLLRYAGPMLPGDYPLNATKLTYDAGRRALTVDPGVVLGAGRTLELVLLPGIRDSEGISLIPRSTSTAEITDVLKFSIGI
jgi:hypothetical protein